MERLAKLGLGRFEEVSDQRDKFLLNEDRSRGLATRATNGYVRADRGSLLFRAASLKLREAIPRELAERAMDSRKGLEFRWTRIDENDVRSLFDAVVRLGTDR